jgi:hypothetical protein
MVVATFSAESLSDGLIITIILSFFASADDKLRADLQDDINSIKENAKNKYFIKI